jgi:hypothetical protein
MSAPLRPNDAAWEPEALELPLEPPVRAPRVPRWQQPVEQADDEPTPFKESVPGSHVIVIDIA